MTRKIDFENIEKDFFYAVAPHTKAKVKLVWRDKKRRA